jgi:ribose/xylose/arabinose/galactoside ABC-type transport system permease subunit
MHDGALELPAASTRSAARADRLRDALARWAILIVLALLYVVAIGLSDAFLEPAYVGNILRQAAPVGIAAIGTTLVMILGGVDLSIGAIISFSAVFCAVSMGGDAGNAGFAVAATLVVAAAFGAVNGALVLLGPARRSSSPSARRSRSTAAPSSIPAGRRAASSRRAFVSSSTTASGEVLPVLALSMLVLAAAMELVLRTTRFGRQIYLIGSNREAARLAGVPVAGVTFACYVISGLFAGLGGIAVLARSGVSSTFTGRGFEFDALAAIVLGGTVFSGGRGTVSARSPVRLVLFIAFNLVNILGFNYNLQLVLKGAIIILASAGYAWLERER